MRFDWFLYGWIDICGSSIYMYAVPFIFVRFDLFFTGLILNERVSLYLCAFNIGWTRFEDFVRNGTPYIGPTRAQLIDQRTWVAMATRGRLASTAVIARWRNHGRSRSQENCHSMCNNNSRASINCNKTDRTFLQLVSPKESCSCVYARKGNTSRMKTKEKESWLLLEWKFISYTYSSERDWRSRRCDSAIHTESVLQRHSSSPTGPESQQRAQSRFCSR